MLTFMKLGFFGETLSALSFDYLNHFYIGSKQFEFLKFKC